MHLERHLYLQNMDICVYRNSNWPKEFPMQRSTAVKDHRVHKMSHTGVSPGIKNTKSQTLI